MRTSSNPGIVRIWLRILVFLKIMSTAATAQENMPRGPFNPATPSARLARRIWISFVAGLVAIAVLAAASGLAAMRSASATGWVTGSHLALDPLYDLRVGTA